MTTFTTIPNSSLEPGKPIRSIDGLALRDNPIAMFEGDPSAPKLQTPAIQDGAVTLAKFASGAVLSACAQASVGAVGTYALLFYQATFSTLVPGSTAAGSSLRYAATAFSTTGLSQIYSSAPSGTWRLMGYAVPFSYGSCGTPDIDGRISLWLRIS